jgi:hypothetical protein
MAGRIVRYAALAVIKPINKIGKALAHWIVGNWGFKIVVNQQK